MWATGHQRGTHAPLTRDAGDGGWSARNRRSDEGIGLLDIAVTVLVIGVVMIPLSDILAVSEASLATGRDDVVAASLAGQDLQRAEATPFSTFIQDDYGRTSSTQTVGGVTDTVTQDVEWVGQGSTTDDCVSGAAAGAQIVRVVASVGWSRNGLGVPRSRRPPPSPRRSRPSPRRPGWPCPSSTV